MDDEAAVVLHQMPGPPEGLKKGGGQRGDDGRRQVR